MAGVVVEAMVEAGRRVGGREGSSHAGEAHCSIESGHGHGHGKDHGGIAHDRRCRLDGRTARTARLDADFLAGRSACARACDRGGRTAAGCNRRAEGREVIDRRGAAST